jgi:hypothetical protein
VPFLRYCWKYTAEPDKPQLIIWRMRIACWVTKSTKTHSEYVIRTAFPLQQWLHERSSKLRHRCISCFVIFTNSGVSGIVYWGMSRPDGLWSNGATRIITKQACFDRWRCSCLVVWTGVLKPVGSSVSRI